MIDEDVAETALEEVLSKETPILAEVRVEHTSRRQVSLKAGQVSNLSSFRDLGMNVRVFLPQGIGFASTNRISRGAAKDLAAQALKLAKVCKRPVPLSISPEPAVKTDWEVKQKRPLSDVSMEERVSYLKEVDAGTLKAGVKVGGRYFELADYETESLFANSEGSRIRSMVPRLKLETYMLVSSKGESEQSLREFGASAGWEKAHEWDLPHVMGAEVLMLKKMIDKGKKIKPGKVDLICGAEVAGIAAHESCGHPMEADRILGREMSQAGKSFVSPEMLGQRVGSEYATVVDDPTVQGSYGYYAYDHEGVRAKPRYLYNNGLFNEFLHNRETAASMGVRSNGSSRSDGYLREPIVRMANTFIAPGDFEEDEIFGSIKEGILMKSFTEWNIDDKRYNQKYVSREAYFIRDGELAGPARRCVLEITTPGFWGAIDAVSRKVEFSAGECGKGDPMQSMSVSMGGPMLRLRSVMLK